MAALNLAALADGIAAQIKAHLNPSDVAVYAIPEAEGILSPPYIVLLPGDPFVAYQVTFGTNALAEVRFDVEIVAGVPAGTGDTWRLMYQLCGQGSGEQASVFDALAADPTFGGKAQTSTALDVSRPDVIDGQLRATFGLRVIQKRGT